MRGRWSIVQFDRGWRLLEEHVGCQIVSHNLSPYFQSQGQGQPPPLPVVGMGQLNNSLQTRPFIRKKEKIVLKKSQNYGF